MFGGNYKSIRKLLTFEIYKKKNFFNICTYPLCVLFEHIFEWAVIFDFDGKPLNLFILKSV